MSHDQQRVTGYYFLYYLVNRCQHHYHSDGLNVSQSERVLQLQYGGFRRPNLRSFARINHKKCILLRKYGPIVDSYRFIDAVGLSVCAGIGFMYDCFSELFKLIDNLASRCEYQVSEQDTQTCM